jgi:hypothetical protein
LNLSPVNLPLFGKVDAFQADHRIRNAFAGIPDVPLERFELTFTTKSPLTLKTDACHGKRQRVTAVMTAHSGATVNLTTPLKIKGCPPVVSVKRGKVKVKPGRDGAKLKRVSKVKRGRVTVTDRAGQKWTVRVRR